MKLRAVSLAVLGALALAGCNSESSNDDQSPAVPLEGLKVAFMPDIHFHDVYGVFEDGSFDGLPNSISGKNATIRTMQAQMNSTRLFNENYFAIIAALDDVVARGIKYVALPGDFSDDGQPIHMRGLVSIFDEYREKHGLEFFAAPGNHDPVRPFTIDAGKGGPTSGGDGGFLGEDGKEIRIFSTGHKVCTDEDVDDSEMQTICTDEMQEWGYFEIMDILGHHGFFPQPEYVYFETPYSSDEARENYSLALAQEEAAFEKRQYEICHQGSGGEYKEDDFTDCSYIPDSTYLVEPVEGLWLMAIDANVYKPKAGSGEGSTDGNDFDGSSNAGYNMMLTHKKHVIDWIEDTVKAAKEQNKVLFSFSHFPMTDFYNGASEEIEDIFGEGNFQLGREPEDDTSKALAQTGLSIHVGGHMHFNDTGMKQYAIDGETYTLFNIQAPSLAGYIPAYKILEVKPDNQVEVETAIIEDVPRFDELFEHYAEEQAHLQAIDKEDRWNADILTAETYYELTDWHIRELTRLRFLPKEWPEDIKTMLFNMDGDQMLTLSQLETDITVCQLRYALSEISDIEPCVELTDSEETLEQFMREWAIAKLKARDLARSEGLTLAHFALWNGRDLAEDFYRLRNADELAFRDIEADRLTQYKLLSETLSEMEIDVSLEDEDAGDTTVGDVFKVRFGTLFYVIDRFATGQASDNFLIDVEKGELYDLKTVYDRDSL
ncbi:metallophosphoesterase family protein [Vibrio agarivorans]|uniref:metallophosphoesterase family protein n=1 Tax=Vibrio agarivorans TaxID=153622 RepID=UPI00223292FE|nr:metallophosphoesterase [Vibrio agarivorans]